MTADTAPNREALALARQRLDDLLDARAEVEARLLALSPAAL